MLILFADPFELQNRVDQLKPEERLYLHKQLIALIACKGRSCTVSHGSNPHTTPRSRSNILPTHAVVPHPQRYKKRKPVDEFGNGTFLVLLALFWWIVGLVFMGKMYSCLDFGKMY